MGQVVRLVGSGERPAAGLGAPQQPRGERDGAGALRRQNDLLRQTIVLFDRLTTIALRGAGIEAITLELSQMLGQGVSVFDPMLYPLASAGWGEDPPAGGLLAERVNDDPLRQALESARAPLRLPRIPGAPGDGGFVVAPITVGARLLGHLAVASPEEAPAGDLDLFVVQHAATVCAQALLEQDRVAAFRLRFKREILETLLHSGSAGTEALRSARLLGLDPHRPYQVVSLVAHRPPEDRTVARVTPAGPPDRPGESDALETVAAAVDGRFDQLVTVVHDRGVVVVGPAELDSTPRGPSRLAATLLGFCHQRFPGTVFTLGASRPTTGLGHLAAAWDEARGTRRAAERLGRHDQVTTYESLGFHRLLLAVPQAELRRFRDEVLGPLQDYDRAHRSDLVATLCAYLEAGASARHAAERLFVHPNTVTYRIGRIETIAGVDLTSPDDRLLCRAALKAGDTIEDLDDAHQDRS